MKAQYEELVQLIIDIINNSYKKSTSKCFKVMGGSDIIHIIKGDYVIMSMSLEYNSEIRINFYKISYAKISSDIHKEFSKQFNRFSRMKEGHVGYNTFVFYHLDVIEEVIEGLKSNKIFEKKLRSKKLYNLNKI